MSNYETPLLVSYSWGCPIHGAHQRSVALASPPEPDAVIDMNRCTDNYPDTPIYTTRLYGNLRLEVNRTEVRDET